MRPGFSAELVFTLRSDRQEDHREIREALSEGPGGWKSRKQEMVSAMRLKKMTKPHPKGSGGPHKAFGLHPK